MGAAQLPLEIEQGSECRLSVALDGGPTSLAGFTGEMQIRAMKGDAVVLYAAQASQITFDDANKVVNVRIPASDTALFDWSRGVYDVRIKNSADTTEAWRVLEGKVIVDHWVTEETV